MTDGAWHLGGAGMGDETELLPCPFCGGEPVLHEIEPHTHAIATFMPDHPGSWVIECAGCGIGIIQDKREQTIATWNCRAPSSARAGALEDGELWSFLRRVLEQGAAIQQDNAAGKYPTYEHYAARMDEAARERVNQFRALPRAEPAPRQQVDAEHRICEHGRDAFADDCGMCDAAGTNWAKEQNAVPQAHRDGIAPSAPTLTSAVLQDATDRHTKPAGTAPSLAGGELLNLSAALTGIYRHLRECQIQGKLAYPNLQGDADVIESAAKQLYALSHSPATGAVSVPDDGCICHGNWRLIISEERDRLGKKFREDRTGEEWTFFGVVHADDDYYYGMSQSGKLMLLSCVGSIENFGFTLIAASPSAGGRES